MENQKFDLQKYYVHRTEITQGTKNLDRNEIS
jgi:hypothetical protein